MAAARELVVHRAPSVAEAPNAIRARPAASLPVEHLPVAAVEPAALRLREAAAARPADDSSAPMVLTDEPGVAAVHVAAPAAGAGTLAAIAGSATPSPPSSPGQSTKRKASAAEPAVPSKRRVESPALAAARKSPALKAASKSPASAPTRSPAGAPVVPLVPLVDVEPADDEGGEDLWAL